MSKIVIYSNELISMCTINDVFYVEIYNADYNKEKFFEAINYLINFWVLINNTDDKYYQVFIFNEPKIYPLEFYDTILKTLKQLPMFQL